MFENDKQRLESLLYNIFNSVADAPDTKSNNQWVAPLKLVAEILKKPPASLDTGIEGSKNLGEPALLISNSSEHGIKAPQPYTREEYLKNEAVKNNLLLLCLFITTMPESLQHNLGTTKGSIKEGLDDLCKGYGFNINDSTFDPSHQHHQLAMSLVLFKIYADYDTVTLKTKGDWSNFIEQLKNESDYTPWEDYLNRFKNWINEQPGNDQQTIPHNLLATYINKNTPSLVDQFSDCCKAIQEIAPSALTQFFTNIKLSHFLYVVALAGAAFVGWSIYVSAKSALRNSPAQLIVAFVTICSIGANYQALSVIPDIYGSVGTKIYGLFTQQGSWQQRAKSIGKGIAVVLFAACLAFSAAGLAAAIILYANPKQTPELWRKIVALIALTVIGVSTFITFIEGSLNAAADDDGLYSIIRPTTDLMNQIDKRFIHRSSLARNILKGIYVMLTIIFMGVAILGLLGLMLTQFDKLTELFSSDVTKPSGAALAGAGSIAILAFLGRMAFYLQAAQVCTYALVGIDRFRMTESAAAYNGNSILDKMLSLILKAMIPVIIFLDIIANFFGMQREMFSQYINSPFLSKRWLDKNITLLTWLEKQFPTTGKMIIIMPMTILTTVLIYPITIAIAGILEYLLYKPLIISRPVQKRVLSLGNALANLFLNLYAKTPIHLALCAAYNSGNMGNKKGVTEEKSKRQCERDFECFKSNENNLTEAISSSEQLVTDRKKSSKAYRLFNRYGLFATACTDAKRKRAKVVVPSELLPAPVA